MEGMSVHLYKGLKGYWRRRGYVTLNGSLRRHSTQVEQLGSTSTRRRRFWRIRVKPKLKLKLSSLNKFFVRLRDAYVNMMLKLGGSAVMASSGYGVPTSTGLATFGKAPAKEYDEKMLVEIYRSLVIGRLAPPRCGQYCRPQTVQELRN